MSLHQPELHRDFKSSLGYIARPCLIKPKLKPKNLISGVKKLPYRADSSKSHIALPLP
jgi:hypothetical protein